MKNVLYRISMVVCLVFVCPGCVCAENDTFIGENAYALVRRQLEFGPRPPGSQALEETGNWIIDYLNRYGWEVDEQVSEYKGVSLRNITGRWEPEELDSIRTGVVLLGAHYDTRPYADRDPETPEKPVPGANDGASGVAVLLELARVISSQDYPASVWIVFFDGEDSGDINGWEWIAGSTAYAAQLEIEPEAVIIVDMVGDADLDLYLEYNSDADLSSEIWQTAAESGFEAFIPEYRYSILDDHIPFVQRGWSAVDIIDFDYDAWHTTGDTLDKVSAESLEAVGGTLERWLWARVEP
ncbi:MAG: M28 family peptidase [Anaerolineales bacterium]|nr:M28 family peptidase [Anaerolineales bacterium]